MQKYQQNETKFNGVYLRNNSFKIKDGAYIINLDAYESIETHWIALYVNAKNVTYFYSFGVKHIQTSRNVIKNKNIKTNNYRIQAQDSIISGYFCLGFIDFMLKGKSLLEYTNLCSPSKYQKNEKIILKYFQQSLNKLECIVMFAINIENLKELNYIFLKIH